MKREEDPEAREEGTGTGLRGKRVLVVDGDAASRRHLDELLRALGVEPVVISQVGEVGEQLDRAERELRPFSLILYDVALRGSAALPARRSDDDPRLGALPRLELAPVERNADVPSRRASPRLRRPVTPDALRAALARALGAELPPAATEEPAAPTVLDRALLLRLLGGDEQLASRALERFSETADASLVEIERAAAAGDGKLLAERAHRLRGGLSWVCAERAAAVAAEIETLCLAGDVARARALCGELREEVEQVVAAIRRGREPDSK